MQCKVLTTSKSSGIAEGLTYESDFTLEPGAHVLVPLRKMMTEGIVLEVLSKRETQEYELRKVSSLLGDKPLLTKAQIQTLQWMSSYYFCSLRQVLRVWLPSPPWKNLLPEVLTYYKRGDSKLIPRGSKQIALLEELNSQDECEEKILLERTGASKTTLKSMLDKGFLVSEQRVEAQSTTNEPRITEPVLTERQEKEYKEMKNDSRPSLLFGITGSGKTEIYAKLVADAVREGKQAILLVPEILLTEHSIDRFEELLGKEHVCVIHSKLTNGERRNLWKKIHNGSFSLVIGSRSALFSPLQRLGLVILDEEHEWTYKNEQTPRYHAREVAEKLCEFSGAKLVLGSATPSLESWSFAKQGAYHLASLPSRFADAVLPTVRIIDLATVNFGQLYPFSAPLLEAIKKRIERKEQCVLFLNRRGKASALLCMECRRRIVSPVSQLPFTVHRSPSGRLYLLDHTSGAQAEVPAECPFCKSPSLKEVGAGTQGLEEVLQRQFPHARIIRADSDSISDPQEMRILLQTMRNGEADILLGTQSVVKGLDLPLVTLAGVLIADVGLSLPHFRAGERVFQLLTQLTGRSGRHAPGEVIIQTFRPDAVEIKAAANHATEDFLDTEMKLRKAMGYPPFQEMARCIFRGKDAAREAASTRILLEQVARERELQATITHSPTLFGGGVVWHVIIRGAHIRPILENIDTTRLIVDVNPLDCI